MRTDPLSYLTTELDNLRQQGLYRKLRVLDERQEATASVDGRSVVNLSSNNYLGLATHPKLMERAIAATKEFGAGSGSVRTIAGTMADPHGARAPARGVQEDGGGRRVPERLRGQRRHRRRRADARRRDHLGRAESREHHRRRAPEPRDDQGVPAQGRRRGPQDRPGAAGHAAQAAHHRRRVQHGRRRRRAAGAVRHRRGIRLHHDGRRRPRERGVREERARDDRSLQRARPRRHPGRHAVQGDGSARRLRRRLEGL